MSEGVALADLQAAAAMWSVDRCSHADVVAAACTALVAGVDSPSLRQLAGVSALAANVEVPDLLPLALAELGLQFFDRGSASGQVAAAGVMARRCLGGRVSPRELVEWAHNTFTHGSNDRLEPLLVLDDKYDIIEYCGMTPQELDAAVLTACRNLIVD